MTSEQLLGGDGMKKFRIITGYNKFCMESMHFKAKPYHVAFYAKDFNVLNFMLVMSRAPKGALAEELESDFDYCLN